MGFIVFCSRVSRIVVCFNSLLDCAKDSQANVMTAKKIIGILFILAALWLTGLFFFASQVNKQVYDADTNTDAIVVLTGGTERVAAGVNLLKENKAEKLLISGVHEDVDWNLLSQTLDELPENLSDRITLGHLASNTHGNALETKEWLKRNDYKSVRLVTASYHMPRSLSEFKSVMPDMMIIPHPVFPQTVKHDEWWKWPGTLALITSEYIKFLVVVAGHTFFSF